MRFRTVIATALAAVGLMIVSGAADSSGAAEHMPLYLDFGVTPARLPTEKPAPVTISLSWKVGADSGSHPPALEGLSVEGDRHLALDVAGVPVCKAGPHSDVRPSELRRRCRKAAVGRGEVTVEVAFPDLPPVTISGKPTLYNLGPKRGGFDLLALTFLTAPVTAEVPTLIEVRRIDKGRYGWKAHTAVPKIAGGYGSVTDYSLRIRNRIIGATCGDGKLALRAVSAFADGTRRRETAVRPCTVAKADPRQ